MTNLPQPASGPSMSVPSSGDRSDVALAFCLGALFIHTLFPYTVLGTYELSTHVSWLLQLAILACMFTLVRQESQLPRFPRCPPIHAYVAFIAIHVLVGAWVVESYWDLKGLINNALALALIAVIFASTSPAFVVRACRLFLYRVAPIALVFALALSVLILDDAVIGYTLMPCTLLVIVGGYLGGRDRALALFYAVCIVLLDTGTRSNVLRTIFPLAVLFTLGLLAPVWPGLVRFMGRMLVWLLVVAPLIFFALAADGRFNVFAPDWLPDDVTVSQRSGSGEIEEVQKTDTRTFIYLEVLASAEEKGSYLFGTTPARGYISSFFGSQDENERGERLRSEVGILNIFTWFGLIGVVLFYVLHLRALYLAAHRSENMATLFVALYAAFNLSFSWVENFTAANLLNFTLWLALGICYSPGLRSMSDAEFKRALRAGA